MNNTLTMCDEEIGLALRAESVVGSLEQVVVETSHTLHAGIYTRTVVLKKHEVIVGALIKIPTTLLISGCLELTLGSKIMRIDGVEVFAAEANRKQVMYALEDTVVSMSFVTKSKTIEECEVEFTDDYARLASRSEIAINNMNITGV